MNTYEVIFDAKISVTITADDEGSAEREARMVACDCGEITDVVDVDYILVTSE